MESSCLKMKYQSALKECLCRKTLQELRVLAKDLNIRLAGSSRKVDIVDRIIRIAWNGAIRDKSLDEESDFCESQ